METNYTEYDDIVYYDDVNNEISDSDRNGYVIIISSGVVALFLVWFIILLYICYHKRVHESYPKCVCRCVCIQQPVDDQHQTQLPHGDGIQHGGDDVPPDIVVSVIRSSSGFFQGTLSAVSTISGHIQPSMARIFTRGDQEADQEPPPYEAPPSYRAATEKPCQCLARSVTV